MLTEDEVNHLRNNKDLITYELLEALRQTKPGKAQAIDILDLDRDDEEYYLDAFNTRISFHGDRMLKKQYTKLRLSEIHLEELRRCYEDIRYFRDNYVRIRTPRDGVNFPDLRPYQNHIIEELQGPGEQYIILSPRQCVAGDTIVEVDGAEIRIDELFASGTNALLERDLYEESRFIVGKLTCQTGSYRPLEILRTQPLDVLLLTFSNGDTLRCAPQHYLITETGQEVAARDACGSTILTRTGRAICISVDSTGTKEPMYDFCLMQDHHYYTNGILSHNSGKSITIATWLAWLYCFSRDIVIGICANKLGMATEFLKNVKDIVTQLPIWMTPGVKVWNVGSIAGDNGARILTDAPSDSSFRGFSCLGHAAEVCIRNQGNISHVPIGDLYELLARDNGVQDGDFVSNDKYQILTPDGYKSFVGVRKVSGKGLKLEFDDGRSLECTLDHRIKIDSEWVEARSLNIGDAGITGISPGAETAFYDPVGVDGAEYIAEGLVHHNCNVVVVDECISADSLVSIRDSITGQVKDVTIEELYNIDAARTMLRDYICQHGINGAFDDYLDFCTFHNGSGSKVHYVLPDTIAPELIGEPNNTVLLSNKEYKIAVNMLTTCLSEGHRDTDHD